MRLRPRTAFGGFGLSLALALLAPGAVKADSAFGCTDLTGRHAYAAVEGAGGTFFRIDPDLRTFHPFSDETVADMARLSKALRSAGTTLVFAPLPGKALAMPGALPEAARDLGFDPDLAATVYLDDIRALREAGVPAVDVRGALRAGDSRGGDVSSHGFSA